MLKDKELAVRLRSIYANIEFESLVVLRGLFVFEVGRSFDC